MEDAHLFANIVNQNLLDAPVGRFIQKNFCFTISVNTIFIYSPHRALKNLNHVRKNHVFLFKLKHVSAS